jgi:hypothetical protein
MELTYTQQWLLINIAKKALESENKLIELDQEMPESLRRNKDYEAIVTQLTKEFGMEVTV